MSKEATIEVKVKLDENNVPVHIEWTAEDGGKESQPSKAMMLNFWDGDTKTAARFDLWTKDMTVDEMKMFFHQTLVTMADTFERATGEEKIVGDMRDFCHWFGKKMDVLPPEAE
jgi:gliding motility-associated protein GldC